MEDDVVYIFGEIIRETETAYWFKTGRQAVWIAKWEGGWDEEDETMEMPKWLAELKGLICQ